VGEHEVKSLPLNGCSYDLLLPLNPGIVNFTWEKAGGIGISNSTTGNNFSISANRPQQNVFLMNGVEYTGAAENNMTPGGTSQRLLGVDAVREFNVLRDSYGAEYGKHPGGQVIIVTQSGSNLWHGSVFEFLRNNALDAPNFFDKDGPPPFQRNQFGGSVGGPIQKDQTFFFANYEGYRQNLHQTSVAFVPDGVSRAAAVPSVQPLLNLWPTAPPGAPDFNGIAEVFGSAPQTIREDLGTLRFDHTFSARDSLAGIYTIDDSGDVTATPANPFSTFIGPGLATWDFSVLKNITLHERLSLQFRAEFFNLLNRANFNTPNFIVFTPPTATNPTGLSGTAGVITSTSTTARQVQFGLKLLW
jgi:hypothetical protein